MLWQRRKSQRCRGPIVRRAAGTLEITQDAFRMTSEPACTYHGDQEKVRGGDLLEVFRVSVSEPFDVNQSQHHGAWRDTCLPAGVKHMQTNKKHFPLWTYQVKHPALCTNLQHATAPTWTHVQRISCGAYGWGSARTCGRIQLQCLQVGNTRDQPTALSPPQSEELWGGQSSPVTGQERASKDTSWSRP